MSTPEHYPEAVPREAVEKAITTELERHGWTTLAGTTAIAKKDYETAVGIKTAHVYLSTSSPSDPNISLKGDYWSEGSNILERGQLIPKSASVEEIKKITAVFAANTEVSISESYAMRLHVKGRADYPSDVEALALAFAQAVKEVSTHGELDEIKRRNVGYEKGICATHDFMDANMVMLSAFQDTFGREPQIYDGDRLQENDQKLWNAAWDVAKEQHLIASKPAPKPR